MYEGYLELGGGEVLNNARALGYTQTAPCPVNWLQCPPCDGVRGALGDDPYYFNTIHEAPWYDAEDEPTHRFLGAFGLKIEGLPDSTREADVAEGIQDGGVVGRVRRKTRRMRVEAMLTAIGQDALEVGFSWLESALTPGKCGTHGDACGAADTRVFTACPPTPAQVTSVQPIWNDPITNLVPDPSFEAAAPSVIANNVVAAKSTAWAASHTHSLQLTPNAASNDSNVIVMGNDVSLGPLVPGTTYTALATVHLTAPLTGELSFAALGLQAVWSSEAGWANTTFEMAQAPNAAGDHQLRITFTLPPTTVWCLVRLTNGAASGGGDVWWDSVAVVAGNYTGPYFDGSTPDVPVSTNPVLGERYVDYEWTGAANASPSTARTGQVMVAPDPIAYEKILSRMVRNLHTVTCVSGPTIVQKLHRGDTWGYVVEFVLVAAVPWMFGDTRPVNLSPSSPVVIQDVPFNLVPYPSAELSLGTVVAATNLVKNPSVEVNFTGWDIWWAANIPQGLKTWGQSTDLAAVGSNSFRARLLGDNGANPGNTVASDATIVSENVSLAGLPPGTRISASIWAAILLTAGAAPSSALRSMGASIHWLDGANTILSAVQLGWTNSPADFGGKVFSGKSHLPAAGAVAMRVAVTFELTWTSASGNNSDIRMYADALAITVP